MLFQMDEKASHALLLPFQRMQCLQLFFRSPLGWFFDFTLADSVEATTSASETDARFAAPSWCVKHNSLLMGSREVHRLFTKLGVRLQLLATNKNLDPPTALDWNLPLGPIAIGSQDGVIRKEEMRDFFRGFNKYLGSHAGTS